MVKMLEGEFPGAIQKNHVIDVNQIASEGALCIVGPPCCGKTTLLKILKAASVHLAGFVHHDMSEIMDWHKNPLNNSPFYAQFCGNADQARQAGNLVEDLLVCQGLEYRLQKHLEERLNLSQNDENIARIRRLNITGAPRTKSQYLVMKEMYPNITLIGIDQTKSQANKARLQRIAAGIARSDDKEDVFHNRWDKYYDHTDPFIEWAYENGLIHMMKFSDTLMSKAVRAVNSMPNLTSIEKTSLHRQLLSDRCEAHWMVESVDHPVLFELHINSKQPYQRKLATAEI